MKIYDKNYTYSILEFDDNDSQYIQPITEMLSPFVENYQFNPRFRSGIWDGRKSFYDVLEPGKIILPKGLAPEIVERYDLDYKPLVFDYFITENELNEFIKSLNLPFEPYDYQIEGVLDIINNKRGVWLYATGSGKSLILYLVLRYLISKDFKTMLIVPNVGLVEQMYNDFKEYGFTDIDNQLSKIYSGQEKDFNKPIIISTWQSMIMNLKKPFLKEIDCIAIDEAHGLNDIDNSMASIAKVTENAKWKFGVTGTVPDNQITRMSLYSILGNLKIKVRPIDLINMGRATPVEVTMFYLDYQYKGKYLSYIDEIKYLENHYKRNDLIANVGLKLKGNSLILFNHINHGELLLKMVFIKKLQLNININDVEFETKLTKTKYEKIKDSKYIIYQDIAKNAIEYKDLDNVYCINDYNIYFIKGEVKGKDRQEISKKMEIVNDGIIVANYATTSTGTNIKNLHNILFSITTKSFVRVIQSIGRGMRLHKSKDKVRIIDFVDDLRKTRKEFTKYKKENYSFTHSKNRLNDAYFFSGYPVIEKQINLGN